jgi:hypothetical protein
MEKRDTDSIYFILDSIHGIIPKLPVFYFWHWQGERKSGEALADTDDM